MTTPTQESSPGAEQMELPIEGMSCGHCVRAVESALRKVDGVKEVRVELEAKRAYLTVDPSRATRRALANAVAEEGYEVPAAP